MTDKENKALRMCYLLTEGDIYLHVIDEDDGGTSYTGIVNKNYNEDLETVLNLAKKQDKIIDEVLEKIFKYGGIDGEHHKKWLIDQIVRTLTKDDYKKWVERYEDGVDGKHTYEWDIGIAP